MTPTTPAERAMLDWIVAREGTTFTDDPLDHGHATRFGITAATLGRWTALGRDATPAEVAALTEDYARHLYLDCLIRSPELRLDLVSPPAAAVALADCVVLFGPGRTIRWAQAAAGAEVDGIMGPATRAAIAAIPVGRFLAAMQRSRVDSHVRRVREAPDQIRFLGGWLGRTIALTALVGETADA